MNRTRLIVFASVVAAALGAGGVVGAVAAGAGPLAALAASSPSPTTFHSNETAGHEAEESAAQEQAENNGTFHPGGPGGPGPNGQSNESASHEATESSSREASEKS